MISINSILTFFIFLIFTISVKPQVILKDLNQKLYLNFSVLESEMSPGKYTAGDDKEQGFIKYDYSTLPFGRPIKNRMITLRADFKVADNLKKSELAILCPPEEYPANIYLNGKLIGKRGDYKEIYTNRVHRSRTILLSPDLLYFKDVTNQIVFQLYPKYGENHKPFDRIYISGFQKVSTDVFWRTLLGPDFSFAVSVFSIIIFLYFITLFLSRKEYKRNYYLYFALLNLGIFLSQVNNAYSFDFQDVFLMERISKVGFNFATLFTVLFVLEFAEVYKHKKRIFIISFIIFLSGAVNVLIYSNYYVLAKYYFLHIILFHVPAIIFVTVTTLVFLIKKPGKYSLVLFIIYCIELTVVLYDLYFLLVLHVKPYILLVPIGMFLVNIVSFFLLAWEQTYIFNQSVERGKQLKELSENLESIVEDRTSQLNKTVDNLNTEIESRKIIQKQLKEANNTKDKLFSIISHDLKNVFNSLISFSELMIRDTEEGETENISKDIAAIRDSSRRAYLFLDNLLEWSAYQTGMLSPLPEKIELKKIVEDSLELFKIQAEVKKIHFYIEIPENLCAFTDKRMLLTVLRNLISNAIKFSYTCGQIKIKAVDSHKEIEISVIDYGIGIETITSDFDKKKQNDSISPVSENGSGLGLLLVRELLKIQNSSLIISSEPGKGSTFAFCVNKNK